MFELPTRLVIAYGVIALMVLAAVATVLWVRHNSPPRRHLREKARNVELNRRRQQAATTGDGAARP